MNKKDNNKQEITAKEAANHNINMQVNPEDAGKKTSIVARELSKIAEANLGVLSPSMVIEAARPENHPLHNNFEWDDSIAGHRYRINQARSMIIAQKFTCQVKEINENKATVLVTKKDIRKYLPNHDGKKEFVNRVEILSETEHRKIMVERKLSSLRSWCDSIIDIEELKSIREGVLKLLS